MQSNPKALLYRRCPHCLSYQWRQKLSTASCPRAECRLLRERISGIILLLVITERRGGTAEVKPHWRGILPHLNNYELSSPSSLSSTGKAVSSWQLQGLSGSHICLFPLAGLIRMLARKPLKMRKARGVRRQSLTLSSRSSVF